MASMSLLFGNSLTPGTDVVIIQCYGVSCLSLVGPGGREGREEETHLRYHGWRRRRRRKRERGRSWRERELY